MKIVKNAVHKAKQDLKATKQEKAKQVVLFFPKNFNSVTYRTHKTNFFKDLLIEKIVTASGQAEIDLQAQDEEIKRILGELSEKRDALVVLNTEIQVITYQYVYF